MPNYADIRSALEQNVANISGVPDAQYRSWQNVRFEPDTEQTWIRMTLIPSRRRPLSVNPTSDGTNQAQGLFQIDIFAPEGNGPNDAETLADATVAAFDAGTVLSANGQGVEITYAEIESPPEEDSAWFRIPVTMGWKAFN